MKRTTLVLAAFLTTCVAGVAPAQEVSTKQTRPALKTQPMKPLPMVPNTYGTTYSSFHKMGASEFTPIDIPGPDEYTDTFYSIGSTDLRRYGSISNAWFIGTPHLPSGARVTGLYLHGCVGDGSFDSLGGSVYLCNYYGASCTSLSGLFNTATGCGYDFIDLSASGYVVDNSPSANHIVIWLYTSATDGTDSFSGVTLEYVLQVSPAPGTATFPDVPTGDLGFQYVEALVASGITGGCGAGLYCPDSPVTRRQMAIFIAKALGLHWK